MSNQLIYKDALKEIIDIQDSYITSNTPDTASYNLMLKWREKVLQQTIAAKLTDISKQKEMLAIKTENAKNIEQLTFKYEAILSNKNNTQSIEECKTKDQKILLLTQQLTVEENKYTELAQKFNTTEKECTILKQDIGKLQSEMQNKSNQTHTNEENYKNIIKEKEEIISQINSKSKCEIDAQIKKEVDFNNTISQLNQKISNQETQYVNIKKEHSELLIKLNQELAINSELQTKMQTAQNECGALKQEVVQHQQTISNNEQSLEKLKEQYNDIRLIKDKGIKEKDDNRSKYEKEINELKQKLEYASIEGTSKYKKECEKYTKENIKLLNANKQLNDQIKLLKCEIESKNANIQKLISTYATIEKPKIKFNEKLKDSTESYTQNKAPSERESETKTVGKKTNSMHRKEERPEKDVHNHNYITETKMHKPGDNGSILNDEAVDADIMKSMENKTEVKVTNRMLSKLNDLQKLGAYALEDI